MINLATPIEQLNKVGKTVALRLKQLGLLTAQDLLFYWPFRYDDFSNLKKIKDLKIGDIATVKGKIELLANKRSFRKKMTITECFVSDETGSVKAVWFRQPFIAHVLKNNDEVFLAGKVSGDLFALSFSNPSYEKASVDSTHTARLVPIYSLTEHLSQKQLRFLVKQVLPLSEQIAEWLPHQFLTAHNLWALVKAVKEIHFPSSQSALGKARHRLKFDELLKLHLQNLAIKKDQNEHLGKPIKFFEAETKQLVDNLGFRLTASQKKSAWQILLDMEKNKPMNRLLEGDVGSGKTLVAALAIANTALSKYQSALLAPTEILALQHFQTFKEVFKTLNLNVGLLTASKSLVYNTKDQNFSKLSKAKMLKSTSIGEIDLLIGTHAILSQNLAFQDLALAVIDEQHRFGVAQRKALRGKAGLNGAMPHVLSMTATPIPRTLALTVYGDLELSVISELPPERKKPVTRLVAPQNREKAYEFVLQKIKEGRQAYVICPLIAESDRLGVKAVTVEAEKLKNEIFPQLSIGLLHGKLKPKEKEKAMVDFYNGKTDIMAATSLVEVGVNVPNASVVLIESAERFGLAQLHQLRGRVNRAHYQSYCLLFSETNSEKSLKRLETLVNCFDGFKLAEEDLKERGFGNLLGQEQSGFFSVLKIASLADVKLIEETKKAALELARINQNIFDKIEKPLDFNPE